MKNIIRTGVIATTMILAAPILAQAGTLENLERERAEAVSVILDPNLSAGERQKKLKQSKHRLIDMERMVLRDKSLKGKNTPVIRVAFRNYDLTFLVHAASEKQVSVTDQWLEQMGVTTASLMNARVGRK